MKELGKGEEEETAGQEEVLVELVVMEEQEVDQEEMEEMVGQVGE